LEEVKTSPRIAVFTNFYPDHLNYHASMDAYLDDKVNIFRFQKKTDYVVTSSPVLNLPLVKKEIRGQVIVSSKNDFAGSLKKLIGEHNYENAAMALHVSRLCAIPEKDAQETISSFPGLPYRLEYLGTVRQVPFYNDSTSTTPIACITALKAIHKQNDHHRIVLILGGNSKNLPLDELVASVNKYVSRITLLSGTMTEEIRRKLAKSFVTNTTFEGFEPLFESLVPTLTEHDLVLFSPAATSFATFNNEFDRGKQFTGTFAAFQKKYGT